VFAEHPKLSVWAPQNMNAESQIKENLIFDLGMHIALDTEFYLGKGFDVVALEANPQMVQAAAKKHSRAVNNKRLTIFDRALWTEGNSQISFYVNPIKDDWSSAIKTWAEKGGHASQEITVPTTTLSEMFDQFGVPYYIKCDIEGADEIFVKQLHDDERRPAFVSIEATSLDALATLFAAGYDRVQIVNQAFTGYVRPPQPAREGSFYDVQFNGHMSGLFGLELPTDRWVPFTKAAEDYLEFRRLKARDETLAHGWLDFHVVNSAKLAAMLSKR
jgi:FkbM family methyltransferase